MGFQFKNLYIEDAHSAMKVGVDSVILAAWAAKNKIQNCLDIGAGCGLISCILAQEQNKASFIALDVDEGAVKDCEYNFKNNQLTQQCKTVKSDFIQWTPPLLFDSLICNPPYFKGMDDKMDPQRQKARFSKFLPPAELLKKAHECASHNACFFLVYPHEFFHEIEALAVQQHWHINQICLVKGNANKKAKRVLLKLEKTPRKKQIEELVIEIERGVYSDDYRALCKSLYLAF